ncbi:family 61 glycoside hydrolase, partial [Thozetella sp. PMI_491]
FILGLAAGFASVASAHSVFTTLFIDDKNQGDGTCVRMPKDPDTATNPIASLSSTDMACGRDGQKAVAFTCSAQAGAKLTFEWRSTPDLSVPGSIDKSHAGPCAVYLKAVSNIMTDAAEGDGWFKIAEEGYDSQSKQFCTEKLIANNGLQSIKLPDGLPTGYYLVRTELLALQNSPADPQFYVGCAQLFVQGSTSTPLSIPAEQRVSIPGYVAMGEPSVSFNIYANPLALPYHIPGPKVFEVPSVGAFAADAAATQQTQGVIPASALITNANWAGVEVPDYTTEAGCWAASDNCYQQQKACYDSAPPSGSKGCEAWGNKCKSIQDACSAGKFTGPPNKGIALNANVNAPVPGPIPPAPATEG